MNPETHALLAHWLREVTLRVLAAEGFDAPAYAERYPWDGQWFAFAYGLGGDVTGGELDWPDEDRRIAANRDGLAVRERCSPDTREALNDLQIMCPSYPGDTKADDQDLHWLVCMWGCLTEITSELGIEVPPEIAALVESGEHLDDPPVGAPLEK